MFTLELDTTSFLKFTKNQLVSLLEFDPKCCVTITMIKKLIQYNNIINYELYFELLCDI